MEDDKTKKEGRESRPKQEQQAAQQTAGTGMLTVRVYGAEQYTSRDIVAGARVALFDAAGAAGPTGVTGDTGEFTREVQAGRWTIEVQAYGLPVVKAYADVRPKCQVDVPVVTPINLQVALTPIGASTGCEPGYYPAGVILAASADFSPSQADLGPINFQWTPSSGRILERGNAATGPLVHIDTSGQPGTLSVGVAMFENTAGGDPGAGSRLSTTASSFVVPRPPVPISGAVNVGLDRSAAVPTADLPLWVVIQNSTDALSFKNYTRFMDIVLCDIYPEDLLSGFDFKNTAGRGRGAVGELLKRRFLPFTDTDAYRLLKVATEAFVMVNCGVLVENVDEQLNDRDLRNLAGRTGLNNLTLPELKAFWDENLDPVAGARLRTLKYLALIANKFTDVRVKSPVFYAMPPDALVDLCSGLVVQKLSEPCLLELIWSYWHEEAMLVQTMNAVSIRFQNRRTRHNDPLANMEVSHLRPLNNLLWGYIQDEQHRLTVRRRGYEYDHEYGLRLEGRAAPEFRTADSRGQFLSAFHNLLHLSADFYQKDDNTTVLADAFPVLNALKEVHLILSQGAHNQFGDLPVTARIEMLMQQWMLARTEFNDFLTTRAAVAYPEPWMDRVDAMKKLQGWSDVNVLHFRDLGVFGEKLLLTIRYGSWVDVHDPNQAKNWLRAWRPEIQGYIHAYRAVTGVDVTAEPVNSTLPSVLLQQKMVQQRPRMY